jgi:hypothetical protein
MSTDPPSTPTLIDPPRTNKLEPTPPPPPRRPLATQHVGYFKKIVMHLHRQFADVQVKFERDCMRIHAVSPTSTMMAVVLFWPRFFVGTENPQPDDAAGPVAAAVPSTATSSSLSCDCYLLHSILKRLTVAHTGIVFESVSNSLAHQRPPQLLLTLLAFKKSDKCVVPCREVFDDCCDYGALCAFSGATPPLTEFDVPVEQFRTLLGRLSQVFETLQLSLHSLTLYARCISDVAEAECAMSIASRVHLPDVLPLGNYSIFLLLQICDFALLTRDQTLHITVHPDNSMIRCLLLLPHDSEAVVVCAAVC